MKKRIIICSIIVLTLTLGCWYITKTKQDKNIIYNTKTIDSINYKEVIASNKTEEKQEQSNTEYDIVGSIKINGTNIDHKVVQGNDNKYYLSHSIYKKKNTVGSIFLDYRNKFDDRKLLIYGHNSRTLKTALFHDLEKYIDKTYFEKHKYIELSLNNQKNTYEIFSVMIVTGNKHMKVTFNDKEFVQHISWMKKNSIYEIDTSVGITDRIVTLQTCYYEPNNSYLLINAKKIK